VMAEVWDGSHELDIVLYSDLQDTVPQPRRLAWDVLADELSEHDERTEKDGPGWSATVYRKASTRGKRGVSVITALVLDVDHEEPVWSLLDDLEYVAHTTWKHHAGDAHEGCQGRKDCPHWRIVLPLHEPVTVEEWDSFRARSRFWLCPNADEGAKDAPRFFWLPTAQPYTVRDSKRGHGEWLDHRALPSIPDQTEAKQATADPTPREVGDTGELPGQRYEREADWFRDLLPDWKHVGTSGDNALMHRPGSTNRFGATISQRGQGVLYVFTDAAPPLQANAWYTKFGAYATLQHGGDYRAAARALAEKYGMKRPSGAVIGRIGLGGKKASADDGETVARPLTETGNAERLIDQFGDDIRYCHPWGAWLHWDGTRWKRDQIAAVRRMVKITVRSIYEEIGRAETADEREALFKWAKRSESAAARAAMLKNADAEEGISILPEDMDRDPFLLNVLNGTINLRTGELMPHDKTANITKLAPVTFDPEARCPQFMAFLKRVLPDPTIGRFMRRMTGYGLTGITREQCVCFMHGGGANGKSTFLDVMQDVLGDYAQQAAPDLLTSRGGDRHPTELADLFGARWVSSIEVDEGKRLAENLVKQMTGGDKLKARFMRTDFFQWTPTHKLFIAANHKPEIRGTDYAIWRRIHLVPFEVTIPVEERDGDLPEKLRGELSGILNWAIAGCLEWQRDGLGVPDAVRAATEEYRQEQDLIGQFIEDRCIVGKNEAVASESLYQVYSSWCDANGSKAVTTTAFGRRMKEKGMVNARARDGKRAWAGLRLKMGEE
jgi:P4 family phage/plasmid primase-like protien